MSPRPVACMSSECGNTLAWIWTKASTGAFSSLYAAKALAEVWQELVSFSQNRGAGGIGRCPDDLSPVLASPAATEDLTADPGIGRQILTALSTEVERSHPSGDADQTAEPRLVVSHR